MPSDYIYYLGWEIGPRTKEKADVLIDHAIYNSSLLKQYMQPDVKYITAIRDPVSWFKSAVVYFSTTAHTIPMDKVGLNPELYDEDLSSVLLHNRALTSGFKMNNGQVFEGLGFQALV